MDTQTFHHDFITTQEIGDIEFHLRDAMMRITELKAAMDSGDAAGSDYLLRCAKFRAAYVAGKLLEFSKK